MITCLILLIIILTAIVMTMFALGAGSIVVLLAFGDVIIAVAIIYFVIRTILRRR